MAVRRIVIGLLSCWGCQVAAAQSLYADPYQIGEIDTATLTVNGGAPLACTIGSAANGLTPKCPLASITTPGTYTLVMTVSRAAGIVNGPSGATVTPAGSASSAPFSYVLRGSGVPTPAPRVAP